jgi:1-acyl-sn-glycerol-3-phosphate acyltransferase
MAAVEVSARHAAGPSLDTAPSSLRGAWRVAALVAVTTGLMLEDRLRPATPAGFAARAERAARRLLALHGAEVEAAGDTPRGAAVVVANHVSYLDPLVVGSLAPCLSIAKGETLDWPLIGPGLRGLGVLFVRRGDAHSGAVVLRRARRALRAGVSVLNFPEGTTSDGRSIAPFRRGIFGLARLCGVPVVPAHVSYDDPRVPWFGEAAFTPQYWRLSCGRRVRVRVHFGAPLEPRPAESDDAFAARARAIVDALRGAR